MSNINWDEAPEWADCLMKNSATGDTEFGLLDGASVCRNSARTVAFNINSNSPDYWFLSTIRPSNATKNKNKAELAYQELDTKHATHNKYERELTDRYGNTSNVDVYDVLLAFKVTCPATQHAIKKLLCSGIRGHKGAAQDLLEAKESITRAIELQGQ